MLGSHLLLLCEHFYYELHFQWLINHFILALHCTHRVSLYELMCSIILKKVLLPEVYYFSDFFVCANSDMFLSIPWIHKLLNWMCFIIHSHKIMKQFRKAPLSFFFFLQRRNYTTAIGVSSVHTDLSKLFKTSQGSLLLAVKSCQHWKQNRLQNLRPK